MLQYPNPPLWKHFSQLPSNRDKNIMEVRRLFLIEQAKYENEILMYHSLVAMNTSPTGGNVLNTIGQVGGLAYPSVLYVQQYGNGVPYLGVAEYTQDSTLNGKPTWSYTIGVLKLTIEWNGANWQLHWRYATDFPPNWSIGDTYLFAEQEAIVPGPSTDQPTGNGVYSLSVIADGSTLSYDVLDSNP